MQLSELLGSAATELSSTSLDDNILHAEEGFSDHLAEAGEQLEGFLEGVGLAIEDVPPEMLPMLQQWMVGGMNSPQVAKLVAETFPELASQITQLTSHAQKVAHRPIGFQYPLSTKVSLETGRLSIKSVESLQAMLPGSDAKNFDAMVTKLSAGLQLRTPDTLVQNQPSSAVALGAVPVGFESTSQTFNQTLTGSLLGMAVPEKITDSAWSKAMGNRLVWMAKGDQQMAQLKISPPNLGTVEIKLTINNDQASVAFVSNHAAVRDAIEQAVPRLREMMEEESLSLVDVDVSDKQFGAQAGNENFDKKQLGNSDSGNDSFADGSGLGEMKIEDASGLGLIDLFA